MAILKFTCPRCNGHELVSNETTKETYPVDFVTDASENPIIYSDKCNVEDHWKDDFSCKDCGYKFFMDEDELVDWIKRNCPQ
jgi:transcription elongation factor Elf1